MGLMDIQLANVWIVAGVILGFQINWFSWRISREIKMRGEGERIWLPVADMVNLASMALIAIGVFILPIFGFKDLNIIKRIFGFAILLVALHPFAVAGHYQLFTRGTTKDAPYFPFQEKIAVSIIGVLTIIYIVLSVVIR